MRSDVSRPRFGAGDVVRLRRALADVAAGCCGIVWGVYDLVRGTAYEADFEDHGVIQDVWFD